MSRPKKFFDLIANPKNSPLGPHKVENGPKIYTKLNVRNKGNKESESCSTTWLDPKTVFELYPNPQK